MASTDKLGSVLLALVIMGLIVSMLVMIAIYILL
jgi:hypothetical protein